MRVRALLIAVSATIACLLLAAPAMAGDNGEGLAGETDDKIVTAFGLGVVLFFVLVIVLGTLAQNRLERRKDEKKAAAMRHRTGW